MQLAAQCVRSCGHATAICSCTGSAPVVFGEAEAQRLREVGVEGALLAPERKGSPRRGEGFLLSKWEKRSRDLRVPASQAGRDSNPQPSLCEKGALIR
ncbi:hypothetical protein Pa4123_90840 [Phytohabitans aurantiacus]|uniref:Uncharacterized protein n=1 Tax=Phytohabitans aurantiacus TaxID=3016789 RepID=A0ABQ5RAM5_9ACTN|nr:hypothetical protein Pa4123_90840 [Phytohabitans aurantiacus]